MKIKTLLLLFSVGAYCAEPSAFGAGDLNAPNPYGLTSSEKVILKNKKEVKTLSSNLSFVKAELNDMQEKIDGIKSVVDAQNSRIYKIEKKITLLNQKESNTSNEIASLRSDLNATNELQKENYDKIKSVLNELSSLIDSINNSYVSKDMLDKKIADIKASLQDRLSSLEKKLSSKKIASKKGSELFYLAKKSYKQKRYTQAKEYFLASIKKNYLPATSNFYLGEINYNTKHYGKAIEYYKKSITLYDKAKFTPTLLLHTFLSFKNLKDKKNAKKFRSILISKYPKSKEAKTAKKIKI